jgi:hypothetical protein
MTRIFVYALAIGQLLATPAAARDNVAVANTPEARVAAEAYAKCVVLRSPRESARVLSMNFTTSRYRTALKMLSKSAERTCARDTIGDGSLRGADLVFAGAVAEALLESSSQPVNVRLARLSAELKAVPFSPTDAVAACVARSDPNGTGKLFETAVGSEAEVEAAKALSFAVGRCAQQLTPMSMSPFGLRSILATASFRLLSAQES